MAEDDPKGAVVALAYICLYVKCECRDVVNYKT